MSLRDIESISNTSVCEYFSRFGAEDDGIVQKTNHVSKITNAYSDIQVLLTDDVTDEMLKEKIEEIKQFLDNVKELQHYVKVLNGCGNELNKDESFYGDFAELYERLDDVITPLYDKVRNYMTKKPYSVDKFKINFECSTLMDGWDLNKEKDNLCIIMRKDGYYYLGIINKRDKKGLTMISQSAEESSSTYEKMVYKLLPGPNKMLPKVFFSKKGKETFKPSNEILEIYETGRFKIGAADFSQRALHKLIDFYKEAISAHEDWSKFGFAFMPTEQYSSINEFYTDISDQGYSMSFKNVPTSVIDKLTEEGLLYLFKITGKDFSPHSKGKPNLHTMYWRMLFDRRNLENVVYKLNGEGEIFFRRKSIKSPVIHKANRSIKNKSAYNKETKPESKFEYDIVKDRRFTVDQFEFHVPITMNFKSKGNGMLNLEVRKLIQNNGIRHIIGLDRGERHLLYLTMIDLEGHIKEQFTLNEISCNPHNAEYKQDYNLLLSGKETSRQNARKNWQTIENIKELKVGYLSQVVHILSKMMIENDAVLVLENLNTGFMRGRQKVEKSVYQKFEKMLIDKLSYSVDKDKSAEEQGGLLHALQLTEPYENFNKYQKGNVRQCGFVFYIPAWNTSKIDPVTGFTNLFDLHHTTVDSIRSFFSKFDSIRYNGKENFVEFACDYSKFTQRGCETREKWTICTYGDRLWTHRSPEHNNEFVTERVNLTEAYLSLFRSKNIDFTGNIKEYLSASDDKQLLSECLHLFKLTLQMRNSVSNGLEDYIISPVKDEQGDFYDSRKSDNNLPTNADANGAYNIARKGLMLCQQIQESDDVKAVDYKIKNKDWLRFAQRIDD